MTFQADLVGLRARQHVGIGRTVWAVARYTTLFLNRRVLKHEGTRRIDVAGCADRALRRTRPQVVREK